MFVLGVARMPPAIKNARNHARLFFRRREREAEACGEIVWIRTNPWLPRLARRVRGFAGISPRTPAACSARSCGRRVVEDQRHDNPRRRERKKSFHKLGRAQRNICFKYNFVFFGVRRQGNEGEERQRGTLMAWRTKAHGLLCWRHGLTHHRA